MRSMFGAVLLALVAVATTAAKEESGSAAAPAPASFSGQLAFSDTIVFDVERHQRIDITGRTARFKLTGSTWTITDSGDTWEKDSIEIETGGRPRQNRLDGGFGLAPRTVS